MNPRCQLVWNHCGFKMNPTSQLFPAIRQLKNGLMALPVSFLVPGARQQQNINKKWHPHNRPFQSTDLLLKNEKVSRSVGVLVFGVAESPACFASSPHILQWFGRRWEWEGRLTEWLGKFLKAEAIEILCHEHSSYIWLRVPKLLLLQQISCLLILNAPK